MPCNTNGGVPKIKRSTPVLLLRLCHSRSSPLSKKFHDTRILKTGWWVTPIVLADDSYCPRWRHGARGHAVGNSCFRLNKETLL